MGAPTPVLVPRRLDNGPRDEIWKRLQLDVWDKPYWNVVEGFDDAPTPFNRSAALNRAAELAGDWDIAIIADADSVVPEARLNDAIEIAQLNQKLVIPHSRWVNVEVDEAAKFIAGYALLWKKDRIKYNTTVSSVLVVPRTVWDAVNGFDERFVGWGWEDTAFMHAVDVITGGHIRLEGDVYHLDHERPHADVNRTLDSGYIANTNHYRNMYKRANDPTQLRRVILKNR